MSSDHPTCSHDGGPYQIRDRYRTLFSTFCGALVIVSVIRDSDGNSTDFCIVDANDAFCDLAGMEKKPGFGTSLFDSIGWLFTDHQAARHAMSGVVRERCITVRTREYEASRVFEVTATLTGEDEVCFYIRDVTDLVQSRERFADAKWHYLKKTNRYITSIISSIDSVIIGVDVRDRVQIWNTKCEQLFGLPAAEVLGVKTTALDIHWDWLSVYEAISECMATFTASTVGDRTVESENRSWILSISVHPVFLDGGINGFLIMGHDVTAERSIENELNQVSRLQSIGQLAAGIAHEINTPVQYVSDNLHFFSDIFTGLRPLLEYVSNQQSGISDAECLRQLNDMTMRCDVPFILEEYQNAVDQSREGMDRISEIIRSMKNFAHPGHEIKSMLDVHGAIRDTVNIARNEWKYDSELNLQLDAADPVVKCYPGELNQVLLNMIVNASYAVTEAVRQNLIQRGIITVRTRRSKGYFSISIADNGIGMTADVRKRIFDPFFTTKEVGKGSGQGLSMAFTSIVNKHQGRINVQTEPKKGSIFTIILPV